MILKKQFNVNWKTAAVVHNKDIVNIDDVNKISYNQLVNR